MTAQLQLERCSSDTVTEGVRVSVTSALLEVISLHLSRRVFSVRARSVENGREPRGGLMQADLERAGSDGRPAFRFVYRVRIEAVGCAFRLTCGLHCRPMLLSMQSTALSSVQSDIGHDLGKCNDLARST